MSAGRARSRREVTLLEMAVTVLLLGLLLVLLTSSYGPLREAASLSSSSLDMERGARQVLGQLARELQMSGARLDGRVQVAVQSAAGVAVADGVEGTTLAFRRRLGPDDTDGSPTGWSDTITYARVADGVFTDLPASGVARYRVTRAEGNGSAVVLLTHVSDFGCTLVPGTTDMSVQLRLELTHPVVTERGVEAPIVRSYEQRVLLFNRSQGY